MSTSIQPSDSDSLGFPELTALGKQIEVLRIGRGLSKQFLARHAGTSRQQLWRVMTGKTELTGALRQRLAEALRVDESVLSATPSRSTMLIPANFTGVEPAGPVALQEYLARPSLVERTLRTLPNGAAGRELKRSLLNAIEDVALEAGAALPRELFDLRSKVLSGEI